MGFSRQEYWSGVPFTSPGDLPNPEIQAGSPAMVCGSLDGRGVWGRMDTCICIQVCSPETITTLLIGYTPIQNKKFFKKEAHIISFGLSIICGKQLLTWVIFDTTIDVSCPATAPTLERKGAN